MLKTLSSDFGNEVTIMRQWLHDRSTFLVLNMIKGSEDIKIGTRFTDIVKKYLSINLHYIGYIMYLPDVRQSIKDLRPVMLGTEPSRAKDCFEAITQNLVALTRGQS